MRFRPAEEFHFLPRHTWKRATSGMKRRGYGKSSPWLQPGNTCLIPYFFSRVSFYPAKMSERFRVTFKATTGRLVLDMDATLPIPGVLVLRFGTEWHQVAQEARDAMDQYFDDLSTFQGVRSQYFVDLSLMAWIVEGLSHIEVGNLINLLTSFEGSETGDWDLIPSRLDVGELLYWNEFEDEYAAQGLIPSYEQYHREMLWPDIVGWLAEHNAAAAAATTAA